MCKNVGQGFPPEDARLPKRRTGRDCLRHLSCANLVGQGFPPEDGLPQAVSLLKILMYVAVRVPPEVPTRGGQGLPQVCIAQIT